MAVKAEQQTCNIMLAIRTEQTFISHDYKNTI